MLIVGLIVGGCLLVAAVVVGGYGLWLQGRDRREWERRLQDNLEQESGFIGFRGPR